MHTCYKERIYILIVWGTGQMSDLTKCQFTITLCLQSKNLLRDQRLTTTSFRLFGFDVLYCNKKAIYIYIYSTSVLIYSDSKGLKICLGFWIHMLWIYSQKLKACTQLLPYKLQSHLRFLSSLQLKAEHPSSCLGLVSWAQHVNTKLGEDLSGCLLTTAGGSRVTENRLSSRSVGRKLLLAVANIKRGSTKNNVTLLPALLEASQVWKMRKQWTAGIPSNWDHPIGFSRSANFVFSPFMPIVLIIFIRPSQINIPKKGLEANPSSICP